MELPALADLIQTGGVVAMLLVFFFGLHRRWWVMGDEHREQLKETERLQALVETRDAEIARLNRFYEETVHGLIRVTDREAARLQRRLRGEPE